MITNVIPLGVLPTPKISTAHFAMAVCGSSQSIRGAYCRDGHYLGVVPTKLANGRLLWDVTAVARALQGVGITVDALEANRAKVTADAVAVLADANQHAAKVMPLIDLMHETGAKTVGDLMTLAGEVA